MFSENGEKNTEKRQLDPGSDGIADLTHVSFLVFSFSLCYTIRVVSFGLIGSRLHK